MPISNYNTGFPNGVTIRNVPILDLQNSDGNVFWVDTNRGSDDNKGTFTFPLRTLEKALTLVKADQGDKIMLAAGHVEFIQDSTTNVVSTSGIQIIGMGTGDNRAHFVYTSSAAKFSVTADDVYIGNIYFSLNNGSPPELFENSGHQLVIENCKFKNFGATPTSYLKTSGDDVKIINCDIENTTGTPQSGIVFDDAAYNTQIVDCRVYGDFSEGCIYSPSSVGSPYIDKLFIDGGEYVNDSTTAYTLTFDTTSSNGSISKATTLRSNNPERLTVYAVNGFNIGQGEAGDIISFSVIVPASSITGTSAYLLEATAGSFYIEDAVIETDNTPLAVGTGIKMEFDGTATYGVDDFYEEVIANLGARKTVPLRDASVTGITTSFQNGSKIYVNNLVVGAFTGGNVKLDFVLRLLEDGSTVIKNPAY
jgi:hypothetical protein